MLAPNLGASDASESFDQASGLTTIPTAAVLRMAELTGPGISASPAVDGLATARMPLRRAS